MTTPMRPRRLNEEMALRVAGEVAKQLQRGGHIPEAEVEDSTRDIARAVRHAGPYTDGYQIAKSLDDMGWDCNLQMAEDLDCFSSYANDEIQAAQARWVDENNIVPPFPIGTRVKDTSGETGKITEVYSHGVAKYCVKMDNEKNPTTRRIIDFEHVSLIDGEPNA
jgi:hypothetical protein